MKTAIKTLILKWGKWQNLKLKKSLIVLLVIITLLALIGAISVLAILFPNYFNPCKELMSENKEVVSQLNTLDPNSAEWNSLYTQTENENPQLVECIFPSDSNN